MGTLTEERVENMTETLDYDFKKTHAEHERACFNGLRMYD